MRRTKRNVRLFTLFVGLGTLGLFWWFVVPRFINLDGGDARPGVTRVQLSTLAQALNAFASDVGRYPTSAEGLDALRHRPADMATWRGPYVRKEIPKDAWNTPFQYHGAADSFWIRSFGGDGRVGGSARAADIAISGRR